MEITKFNNALKSQSFNEINEAELNNLIQEFPYCANFKSVITKIYHQQNDHKKQGAIKNAAFSVTNRQAFFQFLFAETLKETLKKVEQQIDDSNLGLSEQIQEKFENQKPFSSDVIEEKDPPSSNIINPENTVKKNILTAEENIEQKSTEKEIIQDDEKAQMLAQLEKQIISTAVSSSVLKEVEEPFIEDAEQLEENLDSKKEKNTFSGWLKSLQSEANENHKKKNRALIEKFIQTDPQITPKQTAFFSVAEQAKISLAENEDFVTETLAKIYAQQGNNQKAIKAYEILMVKNPKKKTLFAARIKELKNNTTKK